MNIDDINYKNMYISWLKENIEQYKIDSSVYRLTTPFLDRNNDYTEIYIIKQDDDSFKLTDAGETLNELFFSGLDIFNSKHRTNILKTILNSHGIEYGNDNNELYTIAAANELPQKKHMLIQCMQKVSDLFYLSKSNIQSIFTEDVKNFLEENDIRFVDSPNFVGKSKLSTSYDFVLPKFKNIPERMIKASNNFDKNSARNIIFTWTDTKEVRENSKLYVFIQDTEKKIDASAINALKEYDIESVLWSKKDKYIKELSA